MDFLLYNTGSRSKEIFKPIEQNFVRMYVCGPTVYDYPHIGNARSATTYDILYRILIHIYGKDSVLYVRNITDVDDKIIDRAEMLGINISDLTAKTTEDYHQDMSYLGCIQPNIEPKATDHIGDMINIIEILLSQGFAYVEDLHVYFDISKVDDYTKLSGRSLEEMFHGTRIEISTSKRNPNDFVLWKPEKENESPSSNFDSPWGKGRPGWHIECSAMSHKYLGKDFDIHGGGADLIFPHHTNEIAQSKSAFSGSNFAKYWVHNGFLTVNGEKMSKSLGNFITVRDLANKGVKGEIVRLFLLSGNYHKPLDFSEKAIEDATKMLNYWYRALEKVEMTNRDLPLPKNFLHSLLDNMNTPLAIKIINDYAKLVHNSSVEEERNSHCKSLLNCANFLGFLNKTPSEWLGNQSVDQEIIELLISKRYEAKKEKNWVLSDQIRQKLFQEYSVILEDSSDGSSKYYRK